MKGIITKVEATNPESEYNSVGDEHLVEFEALPLINERFVLHEEGRPLWSTSGVQMIKKEDANHYLINTYYSVYRLTLI